MSDEMTAGILELGNQLFDELPAAESADPDYDPAATIDAFHKSAVTIFDRMLWDHLQAVAYDWENQRPEYQEE